jgi:hypothetical protein
MRHQVRNTLNGSSITLRPEDSLGTSQKLNQTVAKSSASVVREKDETNSRIRSDFTNRWQSRAKQLY